MPYNEEGKPCGNGKQRIITSPEVLEGYFLEYLRSCLDNDNVPTIMGFCIFIGVNRDTFYNYKTYEGYIDTIKRVEGYLEEATIQAMFKAKNPAGYIFYMKNKFGYTDKTELTIDQVQDNRSTQQLIEDYENDLNKYKKLLGK